MGLQKCRPFFLTVTCHCDRQSFRFTKLKGRGKPDGGIAANPVRPEREQR